MSFHNASCELHDHRLDTICTTPSSRCEEFHADSTAVHHKALLDPRRDHSHKRWREWKLLREDHIQQYMRYLQLTHIGRQSAVRVDLVQSDGPLKDIIVDELGGEGRITMTLCSLNPVKFLHQSTQTYVLVASGLVFVIVLCKQT